jgi:hypothetical protein
VFPDLGRAFEAAGQSREAAAAYQRYVTTPWLLRYEPDAVELGWTLSRLGALSERLGDTAGARAAWERLRDLWQEADPVLQPAVEAARAGLRRP